MASKLRSECLSTACPPQISPFLQVRVIVERLARRCGYDAVAGAIPEADRKLLTHIRKERLRKDGRRHSEAGSEV